MSDKPKLEKVRAIDVVPYRWALWCTVGGSKPFANDIVHMRWSDDGRRIHFGLDSHNFYSAAPDDELELVPVEPSDYGRESGARMHAEFLAERPVVCATCGHALAKETADAAF